MLFWMVFNFLIGALFALFTLSDGGAFVPLLLRRSKTLEY